MLVSVDRYVDGDDQRDVRTGSDIILKLGERIIPRLYFRQSLYIYICIIKE